MHFSAQIHLALGVQRLKAQHLLPAPLGSGCSQLLPRGLSSLTLCFGTRRHAARLPAASATLAGLFWFGCVIRIAHVHATVKRVTPLGEGRTDSAWCVKKQRQTKNSSFSVRRTSRNVVTRQGYGTFPTEGFGPQTFVQTLEVPTLIGTGDKAVS